MMIKKSLQHLFGFFGFGIHRVKKDRYGRSIPRHHLWLYEYKIQTIVDIGANEGQFALEIAEIFPDATIHSFEPIHSSYSKLKQIASKRKNHHVYPFALGKTSGQLTFHQNEFTQSSSFLEMDKKHKESFVETKEAVQVNVEVKKPDEIKELQNMNRPLMVKIDVQGFELEVLQGAEKTLECCDLLKIEMSFEQLYKNQPLFDDVYQYLKSRRFRLKGMSHILESPVTGEPLQVDAYFVKEKQAD